MSVTSRHRRIRKLCYLLTGSLWCFPLGIQAAPGDEYLRQIETEAKQQAVNPATTRNGPIFSGTDTAERLPLGLQQRDFEKVLQDRFPGTYVFFDRLNAQNKNRIYALYQQDNRVSTLRDQTLRLLSEGGP